MHPGDDPAVAARFLGWLQGRGEPLEQAAEDQARVTQLLAWNLAGFEREHLDLEPGQRERILRLLELWDEFRPSLPRDRATSAAPAPSSWLAPIAPEPTLPVSAPPSLSSRPNAIAAWCRSRSREIVAFFLLALGAAWLSLGDASRPTPPPAQAPPVQPARAANLTSDLALRRAMAAALACRADAARRHVASREAVVATLSGPECATDATCLAQREAARRSLDTARALDAATRSLAARVAPLPKAACDPAEATR